MNEKLRIPVPLDQLTISNLVPLLDTCKKYYAIFQTKGPVELNVDSFRSKELAQDAGKVFPQSCHTPFSPDVAQAFSNFLAARIDIVQVGEQLPEVRVNVGAPLSLLLVNWQMSLFDGACAAETFDYLDEDCMPGWDTWLAIVSLSREGNENALLCLVPPELCREVDSAIGLDAASCMSWLAFDVANNQSSVVGWGERWHK